MKKPRPSGKSPPPATAAAILGEPGAVAPAIPPKWAPYYRALQNLREEVLRQRHEHGGTAAEPLEPHSLSEADSASDEMEHDLALSRISAGQDSLNEIEHALKRIEQGSYGICEATGKKIPPARLKAVPWTRFAAAAERELERKGAVTQSRLGELRSARGPNAVSVEPEPASEADDSESKTLSEEERIGAPVSIVKSPNESVARHPLSARSGVGPALPVRLKYFRPDARYVSVAGSFNEWDPRAHQLTMDERGEWVVELTLPPGRYEYRFLADGLWCDDPAAAEHVLNPHGTWNAVLQVSG